MLVRYCRLFYYNSVTAKKDIGLIKQSAFKINNAGFVQYTLTEVGLEKCNYQPQGAALIGNAFIYKIHSRV